MKQGAMSSAIKFVGASASIVGMFVYFLEIFRYLKELPSEAIIISISTVSVAVLAGSLSMYVAKGAKLLRHTPRVFISYSHDNQGMAENVANALRSAGALVWFDRDELKPGMEVSSTLENAIKEANSFVVLLSHDPGPNLSFELGVAQANNIPVIAALSDDVQPPSNMQNIYRVILHQNDPDSINQLVQAAVRS